MRISVLNHIISQPLIRNLRKVNFAAGNIKLLNTLTLIKEIFHTKSFSLSENQQKYLKSQKEKKCARRK